MSVLQGSQVDGDLFAPVDSQRKHAAPPLPLFGQGCAHPQLPLHISGTVVTVLSGPINDPIYPLPYAMAFLDGDSVLSPSRRQGFQAFDWTWHPTFHGIPKIFGPPVGQELILQSGIIQSRYGFAVQFELSLPTNLSSKSRISFPTPEECANVGEEHHLYGFRKHRIGYSDGSIWLVYSLAQQAGCTSHLNLQRLRPPIWVIQELGLVSSNLVKMSDHYGRQLEENSHRESEEFVYDHGIGVWTHAATLRSGPMGSGQYSFDWITGGPRCNSVAPLMFALPHHTEALSDPTIVVKPEIRMQSRVTGVMRLCRAARWLFKENVADLRRYGIKPDYLPNGPPLYDALKIDLLRQVMVKEIDTDFDAESDLDSYYFSGKKLAKQALQCLTASSILQDRDLAGKFVEKTKKSFDKFCRNRSKAAPLVYENTWKGIISSSILRTGNRNDDFGNGVYNDHHFHYAYFIHTAAVLVYHDHSYLHSIRDYVHDLIRDVNNSDQSDPYFPLFRNFDWFLGHSLATGLDTNIDGKNQESCSEDANVKVWAEVTQNPRLGALADLQLSLFKRSVNHYYFMQEANTNAPACFKGNRVPGILFENKADYTTFFSNEKDAIHMIQVIPITPITSFIRSPEFIWQEWINTGSPTENTRQVCQIATKLANGYQTLLLTQYGIVDPNYVYNIFVKKLWMGQEIPLDDGLSLSWILGFLINQIELNKSEEKNGC
ncbi:hypothetical protein PSHT_15875 [Puccinia striiformis]|uniref:glucan endo-1,3-beta-D-glucosidase n=1 Tax=Puccinia striiformis TaxID=27350 RepID=A0A2S4UD18_9BASI|nr:hypothetical protein PSHT_15875 [Puccinia striiformis]